MKIEKILNFAQNRFGNDFKDTDNIRRFKRRVAESFNELPNKLPSKLKHIYGWLVAIWRYLSNDEIPVVNKVIPGVVLAYVLCPLDLIPDILVPWGFMDDAALVCWLISKYREELWPFHPDNESSSDLVVAA